MRFEISGLLIIIHLKFPPCHLDHAVIDRFIGIKHSLHVGVFYAKQRTGVFSGLISSTDVQKDAHVHICRVRLGLSQNLHSVLQLGGLKYSVT